MTKSTELVPVSEARPGLPPILVGWYTPAVEAQVESYYGSVAEIFERWVTRRQSLHTQRAYRQDVMDFVQFLGIRWPDESTRLFTVSVAEVQAFSNRMVAESKAPKTINRRIASLSSFYKYLQGVASEFRLPITVPNPAHAQFIPHGSSDPRDESKDLRRTGRDEMNLCEFPIATLTDHPSEGVKTLVFEDRHGKLTVIGSDAYGLPTALDSDVIVALIQLTKQRNDFTDPTVEFSRYELLKLLGWENKGQNYRRLSESLHRWVTVSLKYDGCWWNNKRKRRTSASFHILDYVILPDEDDPCEASSFAWNKIFFKSCRDGNLKRLDLDTYFALKSAISKQLYRHLDKRFYIRRDWTFDLRELAFEHVGMSRNYTAAKLKEKLRPALDELEA
ncbi:MAG: replication initiator protein A, partial [Planctomycetaceae bacterium]|nr:replication initiator protein A [Planctomycetaceae bacterium]